MTLARYANLRDGGMMPRKRPGSIRACLVLAILPVLLWYLPAVMLALGRVWP